MAARRTLARQNLIDFTRYTFPKYTADRAHALIAATLDQVVRGEITRLMIFAPPQHGKSELVSVRLPTFWLAKHPNDPVILSSYGATLAEEKSEQARDIVRSDEYKTLFPEISLSTTSKAREKWRLSAPHRGYMLAVGVGGPVTGRGAKLGIIDDPFENWEQAQSKTYREKVWQWWQGTFRTRIWEGGSVVLIMTRWHEDDLAGRLLKSQPGRWRVLRLPALAESQVDRDRKHQRMFIPAGELDPLGRLPGDALAPMRYSKQALLEIKNDVGSMVWESEYQGSPAPAEGNRIKRDWLVIVIAAPRQARRVRAWDKAGTDRGGDYTVGLLMAEADGIYYVEHVVRGQWSDFDRQKTMLQTAILDAQRYGKTPDWANELPEEKRNNFQGGIEWLDSNTIDPVQARKLKDFGIDRPFIVHDPGVEIWIEQEGGSGGKDSAAADIRLLAGFRARVERPSGAKSIRLEPFAAQAEPGNVKIVQGAWNYEYVEEMVTFPNAEHDDQADGSSLAFNKLARPVIRVYRSAQEKDTRR